MTSSVAGLRKSSKTLPKAKLAPIKGNSHWWSTTAFCIPAKPLHLRSMLSKLMRCTENCSACSQHWSTEWTQFFSMTINNHISHNQRSKSWTIWQRYSHLTACQVTTTSLSISTTFCRENASTTSRRQKMLSKSSLSPGMDFYATGMNKHISHWQKYADCNGSYFD